MPEDSVLDVHLGTLYEGPCSPVIHRKTSSRASSLYGLQQARSFTCVTYRPRICAGTMASHDPFLTCWALPLVAGPVRRSQRGQLWRVPVAQANVHLGRRPRRGAAGLAEADARVPIAAAHHPTAGRRGLHGGAAGAAKSLSESDTETHPPGAPFKGLIKEMAPTVRCPSEAPNSRLVTAKGRETASNHECRMNAHHRPVLTLPQTVGAPLRTVTVRDTIGDLPPVQNGEDREEMPYGGARTWHHACPPTSAVFALSHTRMVRGYLEHSAHARRTWPRFQACAAPVSRPSQCKLYI